MFGFTGGNQDGRVFLELTECIFANIYQQTMAIIKGTWLRNGRAYFRRFERKGGVAFMKSSLWKMMLFLIAFSVFFTLVDRLLLTEELAQRIENDFSPIWLLVTLFVSESFSGILPPDLYIWAVKSYNYPYFWVFLLACSSYSGGVLSYCIGTRLYLLPKVKTWVEERYLEHFQQFRRYGGVLITIAAMTPLPYSPVSVIAGVAHYPVKKYLIAGTTRFIRFFLYAWFIYNFSN